MGELWNGRYVESPLVRSTLAVFITLLRTDAVCSTSAPKVLPAPPSRVHQDSEDKSGRLYRHISKRLKLDDAQPGRLSDTLSLFKEKKTKLKDYFVPGVLLLNPGAAEPQLPVM